MYDFGELKTIPLREKWKHEAHNFTPWLEKNIQKLGDVLGLEDLVVTRREAPVENYSLDLLAEDANSTKTVVIENQLDETDHDHLGKLLTYAAGYDASIVVWISAEITEAHRQALEWLNQRTDTETQFFAIVVELLQIDDSKPSPNFKLIVFPNEWQKAQSQKRKSARDASPRNQKYKDYFQGLIDELRENHRFTKAKVGQGQNWYNFSSGVTGISYGAQFQRENKLRTYVSIYQKHCEYRLELFDALENQKEDITQKFGSDLEWQRNVDKQETLIFVSRDGSIESSDEELEEIREWQVTNLLKLKEVFQPEIERALETLDSNEQEDAL